MKINNIEIGGGHTFIVAEIGANHEQDYNKAKQLILAAKEAGADAVKLQTYTPDSMTIDCGKESFQIKDGLWKGQNLHQLYEKTCLPLELQPQLKHYADEIGITLFSTPFSPADVDFLEMMDVPCYKVASNEIGDIELLKRIEQTGKPCFVSTGCSEDLFEIGQAIRALGGKKRAMPLHCVSEYPTDDKDAALMTIVGLSQTYGLYVGLSDHSKGIGIPIGAVAMGATVVEKHIKLPDCNGFDAEFSLDPEDFKRMVDGIRSVEKGHRGVKMRHTNTPFKRSLWITEDIKKGEKFTKNNIKALRPYSGTPCRFLNKILDKTASQDIEYGEPMSMDYIEKEKND